MKLTNTKLMTVLGGKLGKAAFALKKASPEILVVAGVVGTVASAVMACRATTKLGTILEKSKSEVEEIHKAGSDPAFKAAHDYSETDYKRDLTIAYAHRWMDIVKLYAPAALLGGLSIVGILTSNNILRKRNAALAAAYTALDTGFREYRKRVVDRFGENVDRELRQGVKAVAIKDQETGEERTVNAVSGTPSDYARFYDKATSKCYENSEDYNMTYLRAQQALANQILKTHGHLYLNEVYDMLGIERSKAGQIVGWVYDPENQVGDNYVDFGISQVWRNTEYGEPEKVILLDFNVDGNILDLMR